MRFEIGDYKLDPPEPIPSGVTCDICGDDILVGEDAIDLEHFDVIVHDDCLTDASNHFVMGDEDLDIPRDI